MPNKNIREEYNLSKHTWFGTGGKAKTFFTPQTENELLEYLKNKINENYILLGSGSNILFRDKGCLETVIKLGKNFRKIELIDNKIKCGSGVLKSQLSQFALENEIKNFEFLSCIPGTIGGGIKMNAGCFGFEFKDIVEEVHCINKEGKRYLLNHQDLQFQYRKSNIPNDAIITFVVFRANSGNRFEIKSLIEKFKSIKSKNQPTQIKTGGSTFKNPKENIKAWELIKKSGCHHLKIGNVKFSDTHCNFIENSGNSSSDIEMLIDQTINKVKDQFDIILEPEIKIFGEK